MMRLPFRRVIAFTPRPASLAEFYQRSFGLELNSTEPGFVDLRSGDFRLAFHKSSRSGSSRHKLCFYTEDVDTARAHLMSRGAVMGKPRGQPGELWFCDGKDPDGNSFQISNRG